MQPYQGGSARDAGTREGGQRRSSEEGAGPSTSGGVQQTRLGGLSDRVYNHAMQSQPLQGHAQMPVMGMPQVSHGQHVLQNVGQQQGIQEMITKYKQQIEHNIASGQPVSSQMLQQLQTLMQIHSRSTQQQQFPSYTTVLPQAGSSMYPMVATSAGVTPSGTMVAPQHYSQQSAPMNRPVYVNTTAPEVQQAKRQAVSKSMHEEAAKMASTAYQQLYANGKLDNLSKSDQEGLVKSLYQRAVRQLTQALSQPGRGAMRVSIDKREKASADKMFNAEDTTATDHASEVIQRCEEITKSLRAHVGEGSNLEYKQVTQQQLIEACGDTARYLKPYQIVGVNFLMLLYRTNVGGAILADEMGLGKTAQLITYMGAISSLENDNGPHLVVVPASLLENWQRELQRWCPKMKSVVYYGKHRSIIRRRLNDLRSRLQKGETIDDDLSDLQDPDLLADIAASEKMAREANKNDDWEDDDSSLDAGGNESDEDYDMKHDQDESNATRKSFVDLPPPNWDYSASLPPAPFDVLLTSYTLFERNSVDQRADREFLESWKWSHLIMDEAHALKNREAQRTTRLRRVANVSRRRIMMTGTPLQNDLFELQNLMHFLLPQVFASESFEDLAEMVNDEAEVQKLTEKMKQLLGPFVLRRLKTEVAGQLTKKKHATEFIEMTEEQKALYQASLESMRSQIASKVSDKVVSDSSEGGMEKFMRSIGAKKINHMFTHLRKIAQHPLLIRHNYEDSEVEEIAKKAVEHNLFSGNATLRKVTDELMTYSDFSLHAFCYGAGPDFEMHRLSSKHLMTSSKFKFLEELLPKLNENGSRPLIFSQWTAVLDVIEWLMEELRLPYVRLDGSTAVDERLATVDRFNTSDDVFAFLLSTRAGGQGLNLTGADTVILHDVDFNPQIDRQAEDRCHRLGQTKPVMVYRLVTKSTVDQNIFNLSQRKLKLDAAVLDGITTGRGAKQRQNAQERQQMGFILRSLFAGEEDYENMEGGKNFEDDEDIKESVDKGQEDDKKMAEDASPSKAVNEVGNS